MAARYWLHTDQIRVPLDGGSVLVGRNFDCDIVLRNELVSRHHVLVRVVEEGVEVVPLGQRPVTLNGDLIDGARRMSAGDRFEVERQAFTLSREHVAQEPDTHWFVEHKPAVLVCVSIERVTVGGGADDIVVEGWPVGAVALAALGERLLLEANVPGLHVGRALEVGEMIHVASGEKIVWGALGLRVVSLPSDPLKPTGVPAPEEAVTSAVLSFYPRGGRLALRIGARERRVYLAEKRSELVALLLNPPTPYAVGEILPDGVIAEKLWPGACSGRTDINTLLWRVRRDFADAGLDRVNLFERKGGGLRVRLADGARAEVLGTTGAE